MNWEILVQVFGAVVAAVVAMSQIMYRLPRSRTKLKHDLEILNLLDKKDRNYKIVKHSIDSSVSQLYRPNSDKTKFEVFDWGYLIAGIIFLSGGILWTIYLVKDGFSFWTILSGWCMFAGLGCLMLAFEDESVVENENENENEQQEFT